MGDKKKGIFSLFSKISLLDKLKTKKYTSYVIAVILSLVVVVIFMSSCGKKNKKTTVVSETNETEYEESYSEIIENKLVNVLSFVKGCGNVRVMVVTKSTNIANIEMQIEEKTSSGVQTTTKTPVYEKNGSSEKPFIGNYLYPEIIGVLVVAEGVEDTNVKLKIINAIVSVLGIDASKIEVLEGK